MLAAHSSKLMIEWRGIESNWKEEGFEASLLGEFSLSMCKRDDFSRVYWRLNESKNRYKNFDYGMLDIVDAETISGCENDWK